MPLYEYRCEACGHVFEQIRKFSDPPIDVCPKCGERKVEKLLSSPAIQFKGTGWYITDYARKGKDDKGTDKGPDAAAKPGGTEAKPASADSKSSSSDSSSSSTSASDSTGKAPATPSSKESSKES